MQPMSTFDPNVPCRVHDELSDRMITWQTGWADKWREYARADQVGGTVSFAGLILDGWEPSFPRGA